MYLQIFRCIPLTSRQGGGVRLQTSGFGFDPEPIVYETMLPPILLQYAPIPNSNESPIELNPINVFKYIEKWI